MSLLKDHLTRLADFSGRENRQPFWLWILVTYLAQMVLGICLGAVLAGRLFGAMQPLMGHDQAYLDQHPELAAQMMMGVMGPFMRDILIYTAVVGILNLVLVGSAVTRRLHDGDRSGWWASPVLLVQVVTPLGYWAVLPRFFSIMASMRPETPPEQINAAMASIMPGFMLIGLLGFIGFFLMVGLFVLLVMRGTIGPNRYGDDLLPPPAPWPVPHYAPAAPTTRPEAPARVVGPWSDPPSGAG